MLSSRRVLLAAAVSALALAVPGLPATAAAPAGAPVAVTSAAAAPTAASSVTVDRISGITQTAAAVDLYDSRTTDGALAGGQRRTFALPSGFTGVPDDATAVLLNVTAVSPTASGWLAVWPAGRTQPATSTLNYAPGSPTANQALVQLAGSRSLTVVNGGRGSTHVLVSLRGFVRSNQGSSAPGSVTPTDATRVVDTRVSGPAIPAKGYRDVQVTGVSAPAGAAAAFLNVVGVRPSAGGYLVAHPSDSARPSTTTLTYRVGSDRAALSLVRLSPTGSVRVWNMSGAPVHVVVDSFGWVQQGDAGDTPLGTVALDPQRLLDTRATGTPLSSANDHEVSFAVPSVPVQGTATAVVLALTVTKPTTGGHLRFQGAGSSVLNFAAGETVTNTAYASVTAGYPVVVEAVTPGSVHVIVDLVGVVGTKARIEGRVVDAESGAALVPSAAGFQSTGLRVPSASDATFVLRDNTGFLTVCAGKTTSPGTTSPVDPAYAPTCVGGTVSPTRFSVDWGTTVAVGDVPVPRAGTLTGRVVGPDGTAAANVTVGLQRTDGTSWVVATTTSNGTWTKSGLPVGDWVVTVSSPSIALTGETLDEIPRNGNDTSSLPAVLAAGATTFPVTAGGSTDTGEGQLEQRSTLTVSVTDPDGAYGDVRLSVRHSSGYMARDLTVQGASTTTYLRPGAYTVCAKEGSTTNCTGGGTSHGTATPVQLAAGETTEVALSVP